MDVRKILAAVDHTLLAPAATWEEIRRTCDDAMAFGCASVCIPPSFVEAVRDYAAGRIPVCTVVGFPNGYATTAVKTAEAADAVANGADEIDMVVNLGWVKDRRWDSVLREIRAVRGVCPGRVLKVIVETCLLTQAEKIRLCGLVAEGGADYIKTSTGFSAGGATREDVALLAAHVPPSLKIKAAGGIATLRDAEDFLRLGASRLGTSRVVRAVKAASEAGGEPAERKE